MSETPPDGPALHRSLADLVGESQALRSDVHAAEEARRRAGYINLALLAVLGVLIVALLAIGWQNNRLAHQVNETNARMADCTTPGGRCYDESRGRTGEAISNIIRAEVFMAQCSRLYPGEAGPAFDAKLARCVSDRLAGGGLRSPEPPTPAPTVSPAR